MENEESQKREEKERKKAEVRKRLEEASKSKKAKKGFMTPERKKKLRLLLRKMAAEELKKQQEFKVQERLRIIKERCGEPKSLDKNEAALIRICQEYHDRIIKIENEKYDLEAIVKRRDFAINKQSNQVNALRFPPCKCTSLKKVSKYRAKTFVKQATTPELNFRANLKTVNKFKVETKDKEVTKKIKELNIQVNDLRGKFVKPSLKTVAKN